MSMLLEIGPGRGDFLFWLAEQNPDKTISAIEYKRKRFEKLMNRVEKRGFKNISLHFGDARFVLPDRFADESCDEIFIFYSDPWPKRRHAKHRLFQPSFIKEIARVLRPEGKVLIAHDDGSYVHQIRESFGEFCRDFVSEEGGTVFPTFYAEKWFKEGRKQFVFSYRKLPCNPERDCLSLPCEIPTFENS